jgi:hypothetical protein
LAATRHTVEYNDGISTNAVDTRTVVSAFPHALPFRADDTAQHSNDAAASLHRAQAARVRTRHFDPLRSGRFCSGQRNTAAHRRPMSIS